MLYLIAGALLALVLYNEKVQMIISEGPVIPFVIILFIVFTLLYYMANRNGKGNIRLSLIAGGLSCACVEMLVKNGKLLAEYNAAHPDSVLTLAQAETLEGMYNAKLWTTVLVLFFAASAFCRIPGLRKFIK